MEILAPAGSPESLTAAVRAGADAVYLGASSFSARANAHNFDNEALAEAVRYCHAYGVKVYLAVNTVLRDEELPAALELAEKYQVEMPITQCIYHMIQGSVNAAEAIDLLMGRERKKENIIL